jgi:hypothetical protein
MAFSGKVDDNIRLFLRKQLINGFTVSNIALHETKTRVIDNRFQRINVAGVGQRVETYHFIFRVFIQYVVYKISADKSGATSND